MRSARGLVRSRSVLRPILLVVGALLLASPGAAQWPDDGQPVCAAPGPQVAAQVAPSYCFFCPGPTLTAADMVAVWQDGRIPGTSRLYYETIAWPNPILQPGGQPVAGAQSDQFHPAIVMGSGGFCVVWADDDRTGVSGADIRIRRLYGFSDLQPPPWPDTGYAVCRAPGLQQAPSACASSPGGHSVVAWEDRRAGGRSVFAQAIDFGGQPVWTGDGVAVCDTNGNRFGIRVATDGMDGAFVGWADDRDGHYQVYVARLGALGEFAAGWPKQGRPVAPAAADQLLDALLPAPGGGVVVVWQSQAAGEAASAARGLRLDPDGQHSMGWPAAGVVLSTLAGGRTVSDAAIASGQLAVAFVHDPTPEEPEDGDADAWAQLWGLDGERPPGWPAEGLPLCRADGDQTGVSLSASGDGVVFAWTDARQGASQTDIYAQRLLYSGGRDSRWPADGVLINDATGKQGAARVIGNGLAGATILWQDGRDFATNGYDLYAMFVSGRGVVEAPAPTGSALRLGPATPNPAHGPVAFALELPYAGPLEARVLDIGGRRVRDLGAWQAAPGRHSIRWDGIDDRGGPVGPGVYFLRLRTAAGEVESRFVLLR